ncbi:hypothetical protein KBC77_03510 [Candidatus Saccharibacteria bacterium]|nr:hypothetical protein [Candidatus Saccharibacteria bacterium]
MGDAEVIEISSSSDTIRAVTLLVPDAVQRLFLLRVETQTYHDANVLRESAESFGDALDSAEPVFLVPHPIGNELIREVLGSAVISKYLVEQNV